MNFWIKTGRFLNRLTDLAIGIALSVVLLYGLYSLWDTYRVYDGAGLSSGIAKYKPEKDSPGEALKKLMEINPDVCAWITIDKTGIDYPVVQGEDNAVYLNHDVYGEYSLSGSIFLDYKNSRDFSDCYSLLYGHHMSQGKMFGDLDKYVEKAFFDSHQSGTLYLPQGAYPIEIFAFLDTDAYDNHVFQPDRISWEDKEALLTYIEEKAMWISGTVPGEEERILGFSTCDSDRTDGRYMAFARVIDKH